MHTTRTTTLSDDRATAQVEFDRWVHHEAVVLVVVLGTGLAVETTVADADKMADKLSRLAHVLWARDRSHIQDQIDQLQGRPALLKNLPGCQAFSLSLTDKVVDVLRKDEPAPDPVRLFKLFNDALADVGVAP
jgi:hypothetical protein